MTQWLLKHGPLCVSDRVQVTGSDYSALAYVAPGASNWDAANQRTLPQIVMFLSCTCCSLEDVLAPGDGRITAERQVARTRRLNPQHPVLVVEVKPATVARS